MRKASVSMTGSSSNLLYATNTTTITTVSDDPPLRLVSVEVTWSFMGRGPFTNSIFAYRSPDQ